LHIGVGPPVVIAENGMHTERRLEAAELARPVLLCDGIGVAHHALPGDVVAEQQNAIRLERVGVADNTADALAPHPGLARVQVGNHGELDGKPRGPAPRRQLIARHQRGERLGERGPAQTRGGSHGGPSAVQKRSSCDHKPKSCGVARRWI